MMEGWRISINTILCAIGRFKKYLQVNSGPTSNLPLIRRAVVKSGPTVRRNPLMAEDDVSSGHRGFIGSIYPWLR